MIRPQLTLDLHGELIVDNFAGGGGASTGIELALGRAVDIAINHDPEALAMHTANHPQTLHLCEDVFAVDPAAVTNGRPVGLAWFSPDCKHFSKAKGGKPRSKKIRGLAWVAVKWAATVRPRVIILENVEEFVTWGPLLPDGNPDPSKRGKTFRNFVARLKNMGYAVEWRELRACDYGAPTIRKRLILIARCDGRPIVWPKPTHGKPGSPEVTSGLLKPWRIAAECIDWSIPCPSIFDRKRPLSDASMRRIARGIQKFVIDTNQPFIIPMVHQGGERVERLEDPLCAPSIMRVAHGEEANGVKRWGKGVHSLEEPLGTQPASNEFAIVAPTLIQTGYGEREGQQPRAPGLDTPLGTIVAGGVKHALVAPILTECANASNQRNMPVDEPMRTQCAEVKGGHFAAVTAFLAKHYTGVTGSPVDEPVHTVTSVDHNSLVTAQIVGCGGRAGQSRPRDAAEPIHTITSKADSCVAVAHLMRQFGGSVGSSLTDPAGTVTAGGGGKSAIVTSHLAKFYSTNTGQPVDEPMHTVTSGGNHLAEVRAFLIKYYSEGGQDQKMDDPMHTIPTKDRFGLVTVAGSDYQIVDIGLRMLQPHELYAAQGFPKSYIFDRGMDGTPFTKTAQVRMCGNSVCPPLAAALANANVPELAAWFKGEKGAAA